jgi:hypothetical protein
LKKLNKTKLHLQRDMLRLLQAPDLSSVVGGLDGQRPQRAVRHHRTCWRQLRLIPGTQSVVLAERHLAGLSPQLKATYAAAAERKLDKWAVVNTRSSVDPFLASSARRDLRPRGLGAARETRIPGPEVSRL